MVEALTSKTVAWEKEREIDFTYDCVRLLSMLDDYNILQEEKGEERRRLRDQKKLQGQLMAEQQALHGSKPSPSNMHIVKKAPRMSTGVASNKKLSLGGTILAQTPKIDRLNSSKTTPHSCPLRKNERAHLNDWLNLPQGDFIGPSPVGKSGTDRGGPPIRNNSFGVVNSHETESPMVRKPFSPLSSMASMKANSRINSLDEANYAPVEGARTKLFNVAPCLVDEDNRMPKVIPIPIPATPSIVSVPMHTAMTPNLVPFACHCFNG